MKQNWSKKDMTTLKKNKQTQAGMENVASYYVFAPTLY